MSFMGLPSRSCIVLHITRVGITHDRTSEVRRPAILHSAAQLLTSFPLPMASKKPLAAKHSPAPTPPSKAQQELPPRDTLRQIAGKDNAVSPLPAVPAVTAAATKETSPEPPAAAQAPAAATGSSNGTSPPQPSLLSDAAGVESVRKLSAMAVDPGQAPPLRHAAFMLLQVLKPQA